MSLAVRLSIRFSAILMAGHGLAGCLLTANEDGLTGGVAGNDASADAILSELSSEGAFPDMSSEQGADARDSASVLPEASSDSSPDRALEDVRLEPESGGQDAMRDVVYPDDVLGCPSTMKLCGETCSALTNPATGCAAENCQPCEFYQGDAICLQGACSLGSCRGEWKNCDTDDLNGCETDSLSSLANCSGCGHKCLLAQHSTPVCANGTCDVLCSSGWGNCDGDPTTGCEQNTSSDMDNCGGCGKPCFDGSHVDDSDCVNGACVLDCDMGYVDCDSNPANGCEHQDSASDCGCAHVACPAFPHVYPDCWNGQCASYCMNGWVDCDKIESTGCEKQETASDCGCNHLVCGIVPHTVQSCKYGKCSCAEDFGDCDLSTSNGCEINLGTDSNNCGVCGRKCTYPQACMAGSCVS